MNDALETWLQERFATACEFAGQRAPMARLRISPALAEWEETNLLAGLRDHLLAINERGIVESELLRPPEESAGEQPNYRVFSIEPPRLLRENLCQLAATARLIYERGWLRSHVAVEPSRPEHCVSGDGFDLLVRSPAGDILIWVEVRRTRVELEKLVADLRACSRRGPHAHQDCGFPQNHPRHEFAMTNQPAYLWAVAPEGELCLAVTVNGPSLELGPLQSLPPRSLLEMS